MLGAATQVGLLLRRPVPWFALAISLGFSLIALRPGKAEVQYDWHVHLLMATALFAFLFALSARQSLLPLLREETVWAMTLTMWFVFLVRRDMGATPNRILAAILFFPSAWSLYSCWSSQSMSALERIVNYLWFLVLIVLLGFWGYQFSPFALFRTASNLPWISPLEGFLGGMTFMVLVVYGAFLWYFIPIPGRGQSIADRIREWHEYADELAGNFNGVQETRRGFLVLSAVVAICFAAYRWLPWVSGGLAISLSITLISLREWWRSQMNGAPATPR
jgi:hypothetical protein